MDTMIKIQKWGDDLGIIFPTVIANGMSLKEGFDVRVQGIGNRIIIEPTKYNLSDMLSEMSENNIHHCIETGTPTGNEIW